MAAEMKKIFQSEGMAFSLGSKGALPVMAALCSQNNIAAESLCDKWRVFADKFSLEGGPPSHPSRRLAQLRQRVAARVALCRGYSHFAHTRVSRVWRYLTLLSVRTEGSAADMGMMQKFADSVKGQFKRKPKGPVTKLVNKSQRPAMAMGDLSMLSGFGVQVRKARHT
jgi:hypothetical protein